MIFRFNSALFACTFALYIVFSGAAVISAQTHTAGPAQLATVAPVVECSSLVSADISSTVGAPTHISTAVTVHDGKPAPYCEVKGYVEPHIQFDLRLPLTIWTQRFVQTGCGGLCGHIDMGLDNDDGCLPANNGELALAATDMGHSGGMDGQFGAKDYQLRIDFAYRGVHLTTLAAKALMARFYGQQPAYSYFAGCSDGGREALMEAQRFPNDFNGITAGAPAMNFTTQNTFYHGWNARVNTGADGKPILTSSKLPLLHKAVLAQCDAEDGLKDGIISNPLACHFDPAVLECKPGIAPSSCLTAAQVKVVRELYAGANDSQGNKLVLSGPLPGSELAWAGVYIPEPGQNRVMSEIISTGMLKYLAYETNPPAKYTLADLKFDRANFTATTKLHALYDATDPDLSAFAAQGGKLILWHGLADPHITPLNTIAYYTAMEKTMGDDAVNQFARLYLFPGGYHCGGGEGPFDMDMLTTIMAWVEQAKAPNALLTAHVPREEHHGPPPGGPKNGPPPESAGEPPVREVAKPDRTRPVFPYPMTAKYSGTSSIDDATNFVEGTPQPAPADSLNWLGSSFYTPHYELWCTGNGATMKCKPTP